MKRYTYLLISLLLVSAGFLSPVYAAGTDAALVEQVAPASQPDDLAHFVLEKAKQYTAKGEAAMALAVDVVVREAPGLVVEFLRWKWWRNAVVALCTFLGLLGSVTVAVLLFKQGAAIQKDEDRYRRDEEIPFFACGAIMSVLSVAAFGVFVCDGCPAILACLQIQIAPRVYLLENLAQLLK